MIEDWCLVPLWMGQFGIAPSVEELLEVIMWESIKFALHKLDVKLIVKRTMIEGLVACEVIDFMCIDGRFAQLFVLYNESGVLSKAPLVIGVGDEQLEIDRFISNTRFYKNKKEYLEKRVIVTKEYLNSYLMECSRNLEEKLFECRTKNYSVEGLSVFFSPALLVIIKVSFMGKPIRPYTILLENPHINVDGLQDEKLDFVNCINRKLGECLC